MYCNVVTMSMRDGNVADCFLANFGSKISRSPMFCEGSDEKSFGVFLYAQYKTSSFRVPEIFDISTLHYVI